MRHKYSCDFTEIQASGQNLACGRMAGLGGLTAELWQFPTRSLGVQEQNIECVSVQFDLSVHVKCAHKVLNLYL